MDITLRNVSLYQEGRAVLKKVNCSIRRNEVTCFMGIAASGKTALMETIVGRRYVGDYSGTITCNGASMKRSNMSYCQSADVHFAEFTVMWHLYYACLLRLGSKLTRRECEEQCKLAATAVGLDRILDNVVGVPGEVPGISDGERKLLSIALELVGIPPVLCLDDPFVGLDTATTARVADVLHSLAHHHEKTIVCTVNYPSSLVLSVCDNVLLLSRGEVAYAGNPNNLENYIDKVKLRFSTERKSLLSPIEYMLEELSIPDRAAAFTTAWCSNNVEWQHKNAKDLHVSASSSVATGFGDSHPILTASDFRLRTPENEDTFLAQLFIFLRRHAHYKAISDAAGMKTVLGRFAIAGVLFGCTFRNVGKDVEDGKMIFNFEEGHLYASVYNLMGLMFCYSVFVTVSNFLPIPPLHDMRRLYEAELASKLYHPIVRWLAVLLIDIPIIIIGTCIFILISSSMVKPMGKMVNYYCLVSFASVTGFSYANLCVEFTRSLRTSILLFGMSAALAIWFSGYSISTEDLIDWLEWGPKCSYLYWVTGQMMHEEFSFLPKPQENFILGKYKYDNMALQESYTNLALMFTILQSILLLKVLKTPKLEIPPKKDFHLEDRDLMHSSTPLIDKKDEFAEEGRVSDFIENRVSYVEVYEAPPITEYIIPPERRATLTCRRFSYQLKSKPCSVAGLHILQSVNMVVKPGELCAIMGPIGAGKTTLLKAIAGSVPTGITAGSIRINGYAIGDRAGRGPKIPGTSYISSLDCHYPLLTVRETLEFAAMLKQRCSDVSVVKAIVDRTLLLLGLDDVSESVLGSSHNQVISKGQLRRLTVGCGVVHDSSLLLLDQPTCSLDPYLSTSVLDMLRTLADTQRTIVCNLHSPSYRDFKQFDKVVVLCHGYVVYCGSSSKCEQYFRSLEYRPPIVPIVNPADYILEAAARLPLQEEQLDLSMKSNIEELANVVAQQCDEFYSLQDDSSFKSVESNANTSFCNWFYGNKELATVLLRRDFLKEYRRPSYWVMHYCRCIALGLFLGTVFYDLGDDDEFGRMALFLQIYVVSSLWISELLPDIHLEKAVMLQERDSNATNMFVNWFVMGTPIIVNLVISSVCFCIPIYFLSNLRGGSIHVFYFIAALYMATAGNLFMAYAVAFFAKSYRSSVTLYPGIVGLQTFYCGYSVIISSLDEWFRWCASVNPGTYAMAAWFQNELKNNNFDSYEEFAEFFEWDKSLRNCFIYLVMFLFMNKFILYLAMNIIKVKRL